jgi:hypothetical protein
LRNALPALGLALAAAALGAWGGAATRPSAPSSDGPVWRLRARGLVYRFHAAFRTEALFDAAADPRETRDLAPARPRDLEALRASFLRYLRRDSLDAVPASSEEWRLEMEALGYFGGKAGR